MPYTVATINGFGQSSGWLCGVTASNNAMSLYQLGQQQTNYQYGVNYQQWVVQPSVCYPNTPDPEDEKADERAEILLLSCLTKEQGDSYKSGQCFDVKTERHHYRIHRGRVANVAVLDARGREQRRLCAHPTMSVPDCDTMLVQKLMLEYDEAKFLATANVHPAR